MERPTTPDWHRGDWMQTFTGAQFFPMDPRPEDIDPRDIAHALSLLCRYGGHVTRFYSVAEHCVLMAGAVPRQHALAALLHDATEAYVVDVPRPLKRYLPEYKRIEQMVWLAIAERFGVNPILPDAVHDADNRILLVERQALMTPTDHDWAVQGDPLDVVISAMPPHRAEMVYLAALNELGTV